MRRQYVFLLVFVALILPLTAYAQEEITTIDSLAVELWPDYDRDSVLVLLTGTLPPDTTLPAAVTLPFPETAQLNAVARIDKSDGQMKDDIFSVLGPGDITFVLPDLRFRLEYYFPYEVSKGQHAFDFTWLAKLTVNELQLNVQQPAFASAFTIEPTTENVFKGQGGLTYYAFPAQSVPAGQSFLVQVAYTMTTDKLSVEGLAPRQASAPKPESQTTTKTHRGINWPIVVVIIAAIILAMVFVWMGATRRARRNLQVARHKKGKTKSPSRFCSNCGNPTDKEDRFCSKCGSALKGK
ncbi:MAG: zinc ribbon domain-containing protein [Desulfobacteraceae bacterium]|jgi:hypothetical protein